MIRMRFIFTLFLFFLLGLLFSFSENIISRIFIIIVIVSLFLYLLFKKREYKNNKKIPYIFSLAIVILISLLRGFSYHSFEKNVEGFILEKDDFFIEGKVRKKEKKDDYFKIYIKDASCFIESDSSDSLLEAKGKLIPIGNVICLMDSDDIPLGSYVTLSGKKSDIHETENEGGFDEKKYLLSQGIFLKLKDIRILNQKKPCSLFLENLYEYRNSMSSFFKEHLPSEEGDIVSAMVLGEKSALDSDIKDLFSGAGLAYLLVVSGQHISIVGFSIEKILRRMGLSMKAAFFTVIPIVFLYSLMAGFSVSQMRAFLMFFIMLLSKTIGENYDLVTSISISGLIIFGISPEAVFDFGAIFSFAAIFIIALVVLPCDRAYIKAIYSKHRTEHGYSLNIVEIIKRAFLSSSLIYLGTLPIVAYSYFEIPVYQIFISILLIPFASPLIILSLFSGIFHFAFSLIPVHFIIYFYELCCDICLKLPFSKLITGKRGLLIIVLYYIFYGLFSYLVLSYLEKSISLSERFISKRKKALNEKKKKKGIIKILAGLVTIILILFFPKGNHFEISFLSVGQGLGIYIESRDGSHIFIDGGSTSTDEIGKYTIMPFLKSRGIRRIDAWFVTHTDLDHMNGILETLDAGYNVRALYFADGVVKEENFYSLISSAKKNNTEIFFMKKGDRFRTKSFDLTCYFAHSKQNPMDTNANSLGLYLSSKEKGYEDFSFVFTGDMGEAEEKEIVDDKPNFLDLNNVTGLQVAHHGSKYSTSEIWLDEIKPGLAIISVGKNTYGHPHKETIERLNERSIKYYSTMDCGEISIRLSKGKAEIFTFKH